MAWRPQGGVRIEDDGARWVCWGEVDAQVWKKFADAIAGTPVRRDRIVVDLTDVTFMDSSGLKILFTAISESDRAPVVIGASTTIRQLIEFTGVMNLLSWPPSGRD